MRFLTQPQRSCLNLILRLISPGHSYFKVAQDCALSSLRWKTNGAGSPHAKQEARTACHCQATSIVFVHISVNTALSTGWTAMILRYPCQRTFSVSAAVGLSATKRIRIVMCQRVVHSSRLSHYCRRAGIPTVSIQDQEFHLLLSNTVLQALTILKGATFRTLLYQRLHILGMNPSSSYTTLQRPKQKVAHRTTSSLTVIVKLAMRASQAITA